MGTSTLSTIATTPDDDTFASDDDAVPILFTFHCGGEDCYGGDGGGYAGNGTASNPVVGGEGDGSGGGYGMQGVAFP